MNDKNRCVIVAASPVADDSFISSRITPSDFIMCADGGMDKLARIGVTPHMIIGDFDSAQNAPDSFPTDSRIPPKSDYVVTLGEKTSPNSAASHNTISVNSGTSLTYPQDNLPLQNGSALHNHSFPRVISLPAEKDDTDTMYCARVAVDMGFHEILILGALGGRLDHTLANLSVLLWLRERGAHGVMADKYGDTFILKEGENRISGKRGATASILPFACESVVLTYTGMKYPLTATCVKTEYPYTVSNVIVSDNASVTVHSGTALAVIENSGLSHISAD